MTKFPLAAFTIPSFFHVLLTVHLSIFILVVVSIVVVSIVVVPIVVVSIVVLSIVVTILEAV